MEKKDWVQLLVAVCILGTLGFLGTNTFQLKGDVSDINARTKAVDQRLNRIADALPSLKAQVAWEEYNSRFKALLLVRELEPANGNNLVRKVALYEPEKRTSSVYTLTASPSELDMKLRILSGMAYENDQRAISLATLRDLGATQKLPLSLPSKLDEHKSLVLRMQNLSELQSILKSLAVGEPEVRAIPEANRIIDLSGLTEYAIGE
jgi:hypothetical protein